MRVLFLADLDFSLPGGVETHVREIARQLTARGHAIEIFGRRAPLAGHTMVDRIELSRYDIVHYQGGPWPTGLDPGRRHVRTLHFCTAAKMAVYVRLGRLRTLVNPANWRAVAEERRGCRRPGRLIAVAERLRRDFARWHGLDPAAARVIPNGASFDPPREDRDALRARHGLSPRAPVLLTIGRQDFVKGYGLLARAWERSSVAGRGAVWVTVGGERPDRAPGRLITGPVSHPEVIDWIHAADLGSLPSYYEGCGVALLEMLAGGLPTLAHDVGIAADVIRDPAVGRILPPTAAAWADAIAGALERPPAARAPALGPEFSWARIAARLDEVYHEVVASVL